MNILTLERSHLAAMFLVVMNNLDREESFLFIKKYIILQLILYPKVKQTKW